MARELARVVAVYEEQVALSETQSIEAAPTPPSPEDTRTGTAAVSVAPAAAAGGAGSALPPGASPATGGARRGAAWLDGFRRWLRPQPGFGRPDWPRLAAAGLLVALLVAGLSAVVLSLVEPETVDLARYDPEERREVEYLELLREGLRANRVGDPMAAAVAFRRAEVLKPDEPRVQRLRRVAEHRARMMEMDELREQQLALQTAAAQAALAGGRWQEALSTATVVLGVDPENEEAQQVARRARSALYRDQQRRVEAVRQAEQDAEGSAEEEAVAEAEEAAPPAGDATLGVELLTEGEGRLVVRVDGVLIADVGYQHFDRVGLFRRKKPYRGETRIPGFVIGPGVREIHYELRPAEGPPQTGTLEAEFPAGERRTLKLTFVPGSTLAAHVE
jgi:hypothetical protein